MTQVSGSFGGITGAHNRGGLYFRARSIPTNPNTVLQQTVRNGMTTLSIAWANDLTAAQRTAWETYAENVPVVDTLGDPRNLTGLNMYVRSNSVRLQAGLPRVDDGPTVFNLASMTDPSFAIDTAADEVDVTFTNTDDWANEDDAAMVVYGSAPVSPTVNYFTGPYAFLGSILGDAITPPTSPAAIALAGAIVAGQRAHFRVRTTLADGRLSPSFRGLADAA